MQSKLHESTLPPLKRYKLYQQETVIHHQFPILDQTSNLPAKKRKPSITSSPVLATPPDVYSLPAKKRIWAIPPFDLNLVPKEQDKIEIEKHVDHKNVGSDDDDDDDDDDDGVVCCVCLSSDGDGEDPIVFCDGCDLMVHCSCYGDPLIKGVPEGDWFCEQCLGLKNEGKKCCLCPVSGGAMKATTDGKRAHIVCAVFIPEVFFEDPEGREGIDCSMVPGWRFEGECYLCESKDGCVLDCSEAKCPLSFHVTCGVNQDLYVEYQQGKNKTDVVAGFCRKHTDLWQKQQQTGKYKIVARD